VAFLEMAAGNLPLPRPAHPDHEAIRAALADRIVAGQPAALALERGLSAQGQTFLAAAAEILDRPETQEVVSRTLNAIGRYFSGNEAWPTVVDSPVRDACQSFSPRLEAAARLAEVGDALVKPIFTRSTAIGSLMRRKIEPVVTPILNDIRVAGGERGPEGDKPRSTRADGPTRRPRAQLEAPAPRFQVASTLGRFLNLRGGRLPWPPPGFGLGEPGALRREAAPAVPAWHRLRDCRERA
jgi:hypothetical protein